MDLPDQQIASLLVKRDEAAFEQVFKTHYKNLYAYAFTILKNEDEAEETVQQVFFQIMGPVGPTFHLRAHRCLPLPGSAQ